MISGSSLGVMPKLHAVCKLDMCESNLRMSWFALKKEPLSMLVGKGGVVGCSILMRLGCGQTKLGWCSVVNSGSCWSTIHVH